MSAESSPCKDAGRQLLSGIRVIELAHFVFGPVTGAVLADWGADVIKIEHPEHGDPSRGVAVYGLAPGELELSALYDTFNRGKRDLTLDVSSPDGREIALQLVDQADVFLTSMLPGARRRLGLSADDVRARNSRIVYAQASGQGPRGREADWAGFDLTSFWYRSGLSASATPDVMSYALGLPSPGFGDIVSGQALAGAVAAALLHRERTGKGTIVDVSLLEAGLFTNQAAFAALGLHQLDRLPAAQRSMVSNPLVNVYRTSDDRYIALSMLQSDKHWVAFCGAVGRTDLVDDPRLHNAPARDQNSEYCVAELDKTFVSATLGEWIERLSTQSGAWTVVRTAPEAIADEQAAANGYMRELRHRSGRHLTVVAAPGSHVTGEVPTNPAPGFGQHTDEILAELGMSMDEILELKIRNVVG